MMTFRQTPRRYAGSEKAVWSEVPTRSLGWWTNVMLSGQTVCNCVTRGCGMTYHAQETLGDVR
eukprot:4635972-Prymnesium_polylepis.1